MSSFSEVEEVDNWDRGEGIEVEDVKIMRINKKVRHVRVLMEAAMVEQKAGQIQPIL